MPDIEQTMLDEAMKCNELAQTLYEYVHALPLKHQMMIATIFSANVAMMAEQISTKTRYETAEKLSETVKTLIENSTTGEPTELNFDEKKKVN